MVGELAAVLALRSRMRRHFDRGDDPVLLGESFGFRRDVGQEQAALQPQQVPGQDSVGGAGAFSTFRRVQCSMRIALPAPLVPRTALIERSLWTSNRSGSYPPGVSTVPCASRTRSSPTNRTPSKNPIASHLPASISVLPLGLAVMTITVEPDL